MQKIRSGMAPRKCQVLATGHQWTTLPYNPLRKWGNTFLNWFRPFLRVFLEDLGFANSCSTPGSYPSTCFCPINWEMFIFPTKDAFDGTRFFPLQHTWKWTIALLFQWTMSWVFPGGHPLPRWLERGSPELSESQPWETGPTTHKSWTGRDGASPNRLSSESHYFSYLYYY